MIRKNCNANQNKPQNLLDMQSGHSESEKTSIFSVVSSNLKILKDNLFYCSFIIGLNAVKIFKRFYFFIYKNIYSNILAYSKKLFRYFKNLFNQLKANIVKIKNPFIKIFNLYDSIKDEFKLKNYGGFFPSLKLLTSIFVRHLKENKRAVLRLLNYVYPMVGLSIFFCCVNVIHNFQYGLSVDCLGKHIGYIEDEYVFVDASKQMNSRINYGEHQTPVNDTPTFTLVRLTDKIKCDKKDEVADKLLKASDKLICDASGLYINDSFIGAVTDGDGLQNLVDGCLEPYRNLYPDDEVSFVDDVIIKKGYYLTDSLCRLEKINKKIKRNVEEQVVYTVQKGDVPSTIALKNSVPYSQLKQLNPDIEQNLKPGKQIVVSQSKPLLSVQVCQLKKVTQEIPFDIEKREDSNVIDTYNKVIQQGKNGVVEREFKTVIIDGIETNTELINETVVSKPVAQKWLIGTKPSSLHPYVNSLNNGEKVRLLFPIDGGRVSCGWYDYSGHTGTDICAPSGTPIKASAGGKVIFSGWKGAYGNCVLIDIGNGIVIRYAHNSQNLVSVGQHVEPGQHVAQVGRTGNAYGNHCHMEVIVNGVPRNPMLYLAR